MSSHINVHLDETIVLCADILYLSHFDPILLFQNMSSWSWFILIRNMYSSASLIQCSDKLVESVWVVILELYLQISLLDFRKKNCSKSSTNHYVTNCTLIRLLKFSPPDQRTDAFSIQSTNSTQHLHSLANFRKKNSLPFLDVLVEQTNFDI